MDKMKCKFCDDDATEEILKKYNGCCCSRCQAWWERGSIKNVARNNIGLKHDTGKQGWYPLPLILLKPLADVFLAGEKEYSTFNCLQPFDNWNRRFWDATMRHLEESQLDPLAIDVGDELHPGTTCYHLAQVAFNALLRLHNAKREQEENNKK